MKLEQGFIQVYTGNGKGKTTAAIGQAIRALGAGMRVYFVQFMKNYPYGEIKILETFGPQLVLKRYGTDDFVFKKQQPSSDLIKEMAGGLDEAKKAMLSGDYDLIVLDEILVSIHFKIFSVEDVINFLKEKPLYAEVVLTGRYSPEKINDLANLVSEVREIKHYYQEGILSRPGIDS